MNKLSFFSLIILMPMVLISCKSKVELQTVTGIFVEASKDLAGYKIVFASPSFDGKNQDIWLINGDGKGERNLTKSLRGGFDIYPEWAPDAKYVYYTSNKHKGETLELYRVNTTGKPKPERISNFTKEVRSLSISPENKHIALGIMSESVPLGADLKPYSADLYLLEIDKIEKNRNENKFVTLADLKLILSEPKDKHIWHEQPDWEPHKKDAESRIVYVRTQNYDNDLIMVDEIWTIYMDGKDNKRLFKNSSMPRWTKDGKKIVTHEFNVIDIASRESKKLHIDNLENDAGSASLSPNQKYVLFETTDRDRLGGIAKAIYKETKDKNQYDIITKRPMYEPRWSPKQFPLK